MEWLWSRDEQWLGSQGEQRRPEMQQQQLQLYGYGGSFVQRKCVPIRGRSVMVWGLLTGCTALSEEA